MGRKDMTVEKFPAETEVDSNWWSQVQRALCFGQDFFSRAFRVHGVHGVHVR